MTRVVVGQLQPPVRGAPLGDQPLRLGQQLAQRVPVVGWKREHDPAGPVLRRHVVAHQEGTENRRVLLLLDPLEEPVIPAEHPALTHPHEHRHRVVPVACESDGVGVAGADHLHRHRLLQLLQPAERVTQLPRPLVVLGLARGDHGPAHPGPEVAGLALEELDHVLDHLPVVPLRLPAHAGALTAPDVIVEAGPVAPLLGDRIVAAPHRIEAPDDGEGAPQLADVGVGSEVARPGNVPPPGDQHSGEGLAQRHRDRRVALVVLQPDVEAGTVLLDEIVLQDERLGLARHHDRLDVGDQPLEQLVPRAGGEIAGEVAAHPTPEALRLAHVQHLARGILPEVDAGSLGQSVEFALELVGKDRAGHTEET